MTTFHEENRRDRSRMPRSGPALPGHSIQRYEDQHVWIIDQTLIPCSVAEYHCLELLLEHINACVSFATFLRNQEIFPTASADTKDAKQERQRVAYMMSRLRAKMWALGFDIVNVWNTGYILLTESQECSRAEDITSS